MNFIKNGLYPWHFYNPNPWNLQFTSIMTFLGFLGVGAKFIINMNNNSL
jgi:hypothetical protein